MACRPWPRSIVTGQIGPEHRLVNIARLIGGEAEEYRPRNIGCKSSEACSEVDQESIARLDLVVRTGRRVRKRGILARCDNRRKRRTLGTVPEQRLQKQVFDFLFGLPASDIYEQIRERPFGYAYGFPNDLDFLLGLPNAYSGNLFLTIENRDTGIGSKQCVMHEHPHDLSLHGQALQGKVLRECPESGLIALLVAPVEHLSFESDQIERAEFEIRHDCSRSPIAGMTRTKGRS